MSIRTYLPAGIGIVIVVVFWYVKIAMIKFEPSEYFDKPEGSNPKYQEPLARDLSEQQTRQLAYQLRSFAPQRFWTIVETDGEAPESEQAKFAQSLRRVLASAGWIESPNVLQRMGRAGFKKTVMARHSRGGDLGVVLFAAPDSVGAPGRS